MKYLLIIALVGSFAFGFSKKDIHNYMQKGHEVINKSGKIKVKSKRLEIMKSTMKKMYPHYRERIKNAEIRRKKYEENHTTN